MAIDAAHHAMATLLRSSTKSPLEQSADKMVESVREATKKLAGDASTAMKLPGASLNQRLKTYGTAVTVGVFIGAAVTSGVLAGIISLAAWKSSALREAADEAVRLARAAVGREAPRTPRRDSDPPRRDSDAAAGDGDDEVQQLRDRVALLEHEVAKLKSQ